MRLLHPDKYNRSDYPLDIQLSNENSCARSVLELSLKDRSEHVFRIEDNSPDQTKMSMSADLFTRGESLPKDK